MNTETQNNNQEVADVQTPETPSNDAQTPKKYQWEFEGKAYDLLLANRTGAVAMQILSPKDKKTPIGILTAEFAWQSVDPFLDRLDIETIDKGNTHDDWVERENENMMLKNATCFSAIVTGGESADIDDATGETKTAVRKSREDMLKFRKVVQSDLLGLYLRDFHVERWLPEGVTQLDALLSNPTELFFTVKVGDYNNPQHLLFIEAEVPTDDAIANYKKDTFSQKQNTEGDWAYSRDQERRLRFGKKYIRAVQGAMLGRPEELEFDESEIVIIQKNDEESVKKFKNMLNPDWIIRIAEEIAGSFDLGKK
jgi:hypothetical protein